MWLSLRQELSMVWMDTQESSQVLHGDVWSKVPSGSPGCGLGVDAVDEFVRDGRLFDVVEAQEPIQKLEVVGHGLPLCRADPEESQEKN